MTDYFALLAQPRRPWLDDDTLRTAFHHLAASLHPDTITGDATAFAELNAAFSTLRDPVPRLRHLLALESPDALTHPTPISSDLADLFPIIAQARQAALTFLAHRTAATSALTRALLTSEETVVRITVTAARTALDTTRTQALETLRALDSHWPSPESLTALPTLHGRLAFLEKWSTQLREAALPLESPA